MAMGIVAALPAEARAMGRLRPGARVALADGHRLALSGIGAERAAAAAETLVAAGVDALASWGSAAGLDPTLTAGALTVPDRVVAVDGTCFAADAAWRARFMAAAGVAYLPGGTALAESAALLGNPADKAALRAHTGAAVSDMESAAVAAVAARHGVAFLAARVVADDAHTSLAYVARAAVRADGSVSIKRLLAALASRPRRLHSELRALKQLGASFGRTQRTLDGATVALLGTAPR